MRILNDLGQPPLGLDEEGEFRISIAGAQVDKIELTPHEREERLMLDVQGDPAGILGIAKKTDEPLVNSDSSVQQAKMVAGAGYASKLTAPPIRIPLTTGLEPPISH